MDKLKSPFHLFRSKRRLFLSYAREDHERVANLYRKLKSAGYVPWMDTEDITPGQDWDQAIAEAIRGSDYFLACLSNRSIAEKAVLQREIQTALDIWHRRPGSDVYLIPVRLEKCDTPPSLAVLQWVELFELDGWEKLLRALGEGSKRWIRWAAALLIAVLICLGILWALRCPGAAAAALFVSLRPGGGGRASELSGVLIGMTAGELRRPAATDPPRSRAIIHPPPQPGEPRGEPVEYTPVRIPLDALRIGMKFWIGIETSRRGYLYVIDSELFAQTRLGDPFLVFPTERIRGGSSGISRGDLVRLPGESANPPYWQLESGAADYQGEMVTVILAPQPVPELRSQAERARVDPAWLARYEKTWGATVARVFRGEVGQFAAPGELSPSPLLGRVDPPPEYIYRVDAKPGRPAVMSVPVTIRR